MAFEVLSMLIGLKYCYITVLCSAVIDLYSRCTEFGFSTGGSCNMKMGKEEMHTKFFKNAKKCDHVRCPLHRIRGK